MNEKYQEFLKYQERFAAYNAAFALLGWDDETLAPKGARELTGKLEAILGGESYLLQTEDKYKSLVKELSEDETLAPDEKEIIRKEWKSIRLTDCVPKEVFQEYQELCMRSWTKWEECKEKKSYAEYADMLSEVIEMTKKIAKLQRTDEKTLYDVLLNQYEEGFTEEVLDGFFALLRKEIVPLLRKCEEKNAMIRTDFLRRDYDIETQKKFNHFLAETIGFDFNRGIMAEYMHPFTTNLHKNDVRITTEYMKNAPESAMFSTIHEGGHAIFEQDNPDKYTLVPAASFSCGIHESQSRLYENMIGRNASFWEPLYGKLVEAFEENLSDVTFKEWVRAINKPQASLIRTESDELTYCLHIMVRYEIEKKIFDGDADLKHLDALWNDTYEELLGVRPSDDAEGILQDVHWSEGMFGYFPSYAIGNAVAAQIYRAMDADINMDETLKNGELSKVHAWLNEKIHAFGGVMTLQDLLLQATGEKFNPHHYVEYLKDKFTKLYE